MKILELIRQEVHKYCFKKELKEVTIYCSSAIVRAVNEELVDMGFVVNATINDIVMTKEEFAKEVYKNPIKQLHIPGIPTLIFKNILPTGYQVGECSMYTEYTTPITLEQALKINNQLYETNKKDL